MSIFAENSFCTQFFFGFSLWRMHTLGHGWVHLETVTGVYDVPGGFFATYLDAMSATFDIPWEYKRYILFAYLFSILVLQRKQNP